MNIRKAKFKDIENNLLNLYIQGFEYHKNIRPDIFSNKTKIGLKEELKTTINNSNLLVLEKKENVIGYIVYQIKEKHDKMIWVDQLIIDENNRRLGYGKLLLEKIKEIAKEKNCKRIELSCWAFNQNAIDMYEHIGYKKQKIVLEMEL